MIFLASRAEARLNWLSRLRSAKGFPAEPPGLGIDDFLHSGASSSDNRSASPALSEKFPPEEAVKAEIHDGGDYLRTGYFSNGRRSCRMKSRGKKTKKKKTSSSAVKAETAEWLDVTSNALAELFCMREEDDELTERRRKKWRRKQVKPRICASSSSNNANLTPSSSADGENSVQQNTVKPSPSTTPQLMDDTILTPLPSSAVDSVVAEKNGDHSRPGKTSPVKKRKGFRQMNGAPDVRDANSSCYSTEVTVIDTSVEPMKFRKVIYRKGAKKAAQSIYDKCTTVGSLEEAGLRVERPKRKGAKSRSAATSSPNSRTVDHNNAAAECSSVKIQTGRVHSHLSSSSKDTDGRDEVRTEAEEHKDNIPNSRNRKRLFYSGSIDCSKDGIREESRRATTEELLEGAPRSNLSPDHPVNQPMETLVFSLYQVFVQAGKSGLTAREAVSRILEKGLPGLHEGGVVRRIEVAKTLRTSPYFMQLEESKFVLCSAVIGNEGQHLPPPVNLQESKEEVIAEKIHENGELEKNEDHSDSLQDWAQLAAIRKIRTKRRSLTLGQSNDKPCISKESAGREGEVICS